MNIKKKCYRKIMKIIKLKENINELRMPLSQVLKQFLNLKKESNKNEPNIYILQCCREGKCGTKLNNIEKF